MTMNTHAKLGQNVYAMHMAKNNEFNHEHVHLGHYNEITCFSSTARMEFLLTSCVLIILK